MHITRRPRNSSVTSATNSVGIAAKPDIITGEDKLTEEIDIDAVMPSVENELSRTDGIMSTAYHEDDESISLIVYDTDNKIHEFTIPKADLTSDTANNISYITDFVIDDLGLD